jgi:hypothetical protein
MIDDCFLYAVRKQKKYLQAYANSKASWCYFPYNAHLFTTKDMAEDFAMVVHRLTETSNFIDYLKTSPLFSKSLIDVMVTAIDNGVALLTDQPEIVRCKVLMGR